MRLPRLASAVLVLVASQATLLVGAGAAWGAAGDIDGVTTTDGAVEMVFSLPDLPEGETPDLDSVVVSVDGDQVDASAESAGDATSLQRVTVLTMDTSDSMLGAPFEAAREAAISFIDQAPPDVRIGLVAFAGDVRLVAEPTDDRDALRTAVTELELSRFTRLYEGIGVALDSLRGEDQGSLLVFSDGREDTTDDPVSATLKAVRTSDARVDVVALRPESGAIANLEAIAGAGGGELSNATDPAALQGLFEAQARVLDSQLLVSFAAPDGWEGGDATVDISVTAGDETYTDSALVRLTATEAEQGEGSTTPLPADEPMFQIDRPVMIGGLAALAVGCALLVIMTTGAFSMPERRKSATDRLAPYGLGAAGAQAMGSGPGSSAGVVNRAVDATDKMIKGGGLDVRLAKKLDAAGMSMHAAEWLLMHAGIAVGAGFVGFLMSGRILVTALLLVAGLVLPWLYLRRKESKRIKQFDGQLADTLQLVSGSLSAGLSLTQALDTVVREGNEPVSGEFRRALVEQRLGVEVEIALDGVATRMKSDDFSWVVMAIRIQRDVGGNLAELLLTVAATLREREYLRRQVKTLSAEGRLSAWILGGLPPVFLGYLMLVQPTYLDPMLNSTLGLLMLATAAVMMGIGVFVLNKMVKVEV